MGMGESMISSPCSQGAKTFGQQIVLFREAIDAALTELQQSHLGS